MALPRFHCQLPLTKGHSLALPPDAARHVQVLRLQPGDAITLFGAPDAPSESEFEARIQSISRSEVQVLVGAARRVSREAALTVHLAVGVPAGDRMDWLVEKATELGAASVWPLITQRAVLRLHGERAIKKVRHWQAVAIAACEQCGRNQVPVVHPIVDLASWLVALAPPSPAALRCLLAPGASAQSLTQLQARLHEQAAPAVWALSGPEGGLTSQEEEVARQKGFVAVNLGPRVLRAETAPLALLAHLTLTA